MGTATGSCLSAGDLAIVNDAVEAELSLMYGDDAEPSDTELFDCLDCDFDPCPDNPGGHVYVGKCGETRCIHCKKIVG